MTDVTKGDAMVALGEVSQMIGWMQAHVQFHQGKDCRMCVDQGAKLEATMGHLATLGTYITVKGLP